MTPKSTLEEVMEAFSYDTAEWRESDALFPHAVLA